MFDIVPYEGAGPIRFGMTQNEVIQSMGKPKREIINRLAQVQLYYPQCFVILSKEEKRVVEIVIFPTTRARVCGINIFRERNAFGELLVLDGAPLADLGAIVLLKLGIAINDFRHCAPSEREVTAFARGVWDHVKDEMRPFPWDQ